MHSHALVWQLRLLISLVSIRWSHEQHFCSVFQPFRVTPENAKFQIGGPFPLHTENCMHVRPDVVQELIGVQWALAQWNPKSESTNFRLALSAFDTCSRGQESLSQTMTFLHDSGFFRPQECQSSQRVPLGLIMPSMHDRRLKGLTETLTSAEVPVIAYSGSTAQTLIDAKVPTVFSTAPLIDHLMQATIALLQSLNSDLVTIYYSDQHVTSATLKKQLSVLAKSRIFYTNPTPITDAKTFDPNSSEIVIMIASKDELINYFMTTPHLSANNLKKLFIIVPALGESWNHEEMADFLLPKRSSYRLIFIQQAKIFDEKEFRDYFLDVIHNNYQSYALLATYMQQVYNCSLVGTEGMTDCGQVDVEDMINGYVTNRQVESAILATYIYGALAKHIGDSAKETCSSASPACTKMIIRYLMDNFTYTFGDTDPRPYRGFVAKFGDDRTLMSIPIEGLYAGWEAAELKLESVFNFTTGARMESKRVHSTSIRWYDGNAVGTHCEQWRSECQSCTDDRKYNPGPDLAWATEQSDLYILGLFDMRNGCSAADSNGCDRSIDNLKNILLPVAFSYVLENIRHKHAESKLLPGLKLGGIIFDSCHDQISNLETIVAVSSDRCLAVRGSDDSNLTVASRNVIALVSGQCGFLSNIAAKVVNSNPGVDRKLWIGRSDQDDGGQCAQSYGRDPFTPDIDAQSKALTALLLRYGWTYVSILLSEHDDYCLQAYESFRRLAETDDRLCIADVVRVKSGERIQLVRNANSPSSKIVLAFTTASDTILALKASSSYRGHSNDAAPIYVFVGDAHDWTIEAKQQSGAHTWKTAALGALSLQARVSEDKNLKNFLTTLNPTNFPQKWFIDAWQDYFNCSINSNSSEGKSSKKLCTSEERLQFDPTTREAYFMSAMENFILSLDKFYKKSCPGQDGLCAAFFTEGYFTKITEFLSQMERGDQFAIYNYRPDADNVNGGDYVEIGNWSSPDGLKLSDSWVWYDEERKANSSIPESTCEPPFCHCRMQHDVAKKVHSSGATVPEHLLADQRLLDTSGLQMKASNKNEDGDGNDAGAEITSATTATHWKKQLWTYIFLVINSILLVAACLVLAVVSVKLCCGIVKGNQSLGICLLFSIILIYSTAYFFIFDPCETLCRLRYIAHSFAYSVCFGVMIAKAVQLRNSETLGFNGFISYWNYWLLLFFIVAVQMALNMQWALVRHPVIVSVIDDAGTDSPTVILRCSWSTGEFLASQTYVILLLFMASFMALLNRNVKRNYKETRWLMYTSFICIFIWALWMVGYAAAPDAFKDTVVVMELMICATVVLCFMFGPKLYILLRYESMLNDNSAASKLSMGPQIGVGDIDKRHSVALSANKDDVGIRYFDVDDLHEEEGRRSALSIGSVKSSATLSHTLSSSSSTSTDSSASATGLKSKNRNKSNKSVAPVESRTANTTENHPSPKTNSEETVS